MPQEVAPEDPLVTGQAPGQTEMFYPTGAPTYQAAPTTPEEMNAAARNEVLTRMYPLIGGGPKSRSVQKKPRAEALARAVAGGVIEEEGDTYVTLVNDLAQGAYKSFDKIFREAMDAAAQPAAVEAAPEPEVTAQEAPVVAPEPVEAAPEPVVEVAPTPAPAAKVTTVEELPDEAWEQGYRTSEEEPAFTDLNDAMQQEWEQAHAAGKATTKLFDNLVRRHRANTRAEKINAKAAKQNKDLGESDEMNSIDFSYRELLSTRIKDFQYAMFAAGDTLEKALKAAMPFLTEKQQVLAQNLLSMPYTRNAKFTFSADPKMEGRAATAGTYNSTEHRVTLYGYSTPKTLLHEAIHAATAEAVRRETYQDKNGTYFGRTLYARRLIMLFDRAQMEAINDEVRHYGLTNLDEFLAEAFSNPEFQKWMQTIKMPGEGSKPKQSMWKKFVDAVSDWIYKKEGETDLLSEVLAAAEPFLQGSSGAAPSGTPIMPSIIALDKAVAYAKYDTPVADLAAKAKKLGMKVLNLHQLDDLYGDKLSITEEGKTRRPIKEFIDSLLKMGRERSESLRVADVVKQKLAALPAQSRDRMGRVLTGMSDLNASTEVKMSGGKVSDVTVVDLGDIAPEEAQELWDSLSAAERKIYGEVKNEIENLRQNLLKATKENMEEYGEKGVGLLNQVLAQYTSVKGDYFPFMRFGDHVVVWRSDEFKEAEAAGDQGEINRLKADRQNPHYVVQRFESKGEANRLLDELKAKGTLSGLKGSVEYHKQQDYISGLDRVPPSFINKLNEVFDVNTEGLQKQLAEARKLGDTAAARKLEQSIDRAKYGEEMKKYVASLYVQALPEYSAAKRHLKRAGIRGYSTDAVRAFSHYADRVSSATAKARNMRDVLGALTLAENAAREAERGGDQTYKDVVDVLRRHYDAIINPKYQSGEIQAAMTSLAYVWYLGMTPSFAITNLAQGPLISAPVIAARLGVSNFKVQAALMKAFKDAFAVQKTWLAEAEGNLFRRMYQSGPGYTTTEEGLKLDLSGTALTKDEQELIQHLYKQSLVDLNQTHDITGSAEGDSVLQSEAMRVITMFAHHSEVLNRLATGLAAYRLAKQMGRAKGTSTDPMAFSERIIRDTHFDYSNTAAPLYFKPGYNPVARLMFQFRKYQQAMLFLLGRNLSQAFGTGEEAKIARKTLAGLMVSHVIAAGTLGMPLVGGVGALVAAALNTKDDPWDKERVNAEYRNFLADTLGQDAGEVVARGALRIPGIRDVLPGTVGEKIGQQDVLSPMRNLRASNRENARDTMLKTIGAFVVGPAGGLAGDLLTAFEMFGRGEMQRGYEYATPKFVRDSFKTYRFAEEGLVNTTGNTKVSSDKLTPIDLFWQAMGYTPTDVAEAYEANAAVTNYTQKLTQRRSALISRYANAKMKGDEETAAEIRDTLVARFNTANPTERILPKDLFGAYRSRMKDQRMTNEQGIVEDRRRPARAEVGRFANVE
jgi:hypothetical protein